MLSLINKISHKSSGKQGQKIDETKFGYKYKIILKGESYRNRMFYLTTKHYPKCYFLIECNHNQVIRSRNVKKLEFV